MSTASTSHPCLPRSLFLLGGQKSGKSRRAELLARHLTHSSTQPCIHYWNDGQREVDYVLAQGAGLLALEVKSGTHTGNVSGLDAFCAAHPAARPLVLGTGGLPLELWFASGAAF